MSSFYIQMTGDLADHYRVFDADDDLDFTTAFATDISLLEGRLLADSAMSRL